ncbi:MAG: hypothetical protein JNL18_18685 [Planctomycetaceae bacterium]|nr:hypothetical protein [Planctomycetaceae bacterium]
MTIKTIPAQGIDLDRHELPQRDTPQRGGSNADSAPVLYAGHGVAVQVTDEGVNARVDVANKHAITPEAMKFIITAAIAALNFKPAPNLQLDENGVPLADFNW